MFEKFRELGSARQVLLWMASQNIHFPYPLERPDIEVVRVAADQVSQCHLGRSHPDANAADPGRFCLTDRGRDWLTRADASHFIARKYQVLVPLLST